MDNVMSKKEEYCSDASFILLDDGLNACLWFIREQPQGARPRHRLDAGMHSQLREDTAQMAFDCIDREHQSVSNLLVGVSLYHQVEDFKFASGKRVQQRLHRQALFRRLGLMLRSSAILEKRREQLYHLDLLQTLMKRRYHTAEPEVKRRYLASHKRVNAARWHTALPLRSLDSSGVAHIMPVLETERHPKA